MYKTMHGSKIEIWSSDQINDVHKHEEYYQKVVLQVEHAFANFFTVEHINSRLYDIEMAERKRK